MRTSPEFGRRDRSVRGDPAVPPSTDYGCRLPLLSIILLRINGLRARRGTGTGVSAMQPIPWAQPSRMTTLGPNQILLVYPDGKKFFQTMQNPAQ